MACRPSALPRSAAGKLPVRIAGEVANIIAPPNACTPRKAINWPTVEARLHSAEPAINTPKPAMYTRPWPAQVTHPSEAQQQPTDEQ